MEWDREGGQIRVQFQAVPWWQLWLHLKWCLGTPQSGLIQRRGSWSIYIPGPSSHWLRTDSGEPSGSLCTRQSCFQLPESHSQTRTWSWLCRAGLPSHDHSHDTQEVLVAPSGGSSGFGGSPSAAWCLQGFSDLRKVREANSYGNLVHQHVEVPAGVPTHTRHQVLNPLGLP